MAYRGEVLEPATYLTLLGDLQADFLTSVEAADPDAPVPTCGDWSVGDLVDHLAGIHHMAATMARGERTQRLGVPVDLAAHYDSAAAELRTTLAEVGPDATGRILSGLTDDDRGPVSFWYRRQVHETLIHLYDLRSALGQAAPDVPPQVWADNVDETVTVMHPRQVALGRTPQVVTRVELAATDADGSWALGAANAVQRVAVSGPARDLALVLWRRTTPTAADVVVEGDRQALAEVLDRAIAP